MKTRTTFKLLTCGDFIMTHRSGRLNLEESKKGLAQLAAVAESSGTCDVILDCRAITLERPLTYPELYELVAELGRHRSAFRNKVAILSRPDSQFDRASLCEEIARHRGFQIGTFSDFEQAVNWLSETANPAPPENTPNNQRGA